MHFSVELQSSYKLPEFKYHQQLCSSLKDLAPIIYSDSYLTPPPTQYHTKMEYDTKTRMSVSTNNAQKYRLIIQRRL